MPDLNQANPLVVNYLIQNAIWWIEYANLDGFRVDTYSYCDKQGIAEWTKAIMDEYPNFNIVGEVWLHDQAQISYWQKDSEIGALQSFNSYCPSVMDFTLHDAIGTVFNEANPNWFDGMIKVYENFVNDFLYPDPNNILVFLENHDTQRFNEIYPDLKNYKLGMTLINTVRGIPQIYYGSEVGMKGNKGEGDGDIRRDFPGGWSEDSQNAFESSSRTKEQEAYHAFTKKLLNWRKNAGVIHNGKTMHFLPENNVYVYFRYNDNEKVMIILNNSSEDQTLKLERFNEMLNDKKSGTCVLTGETMDLSSTTFIAKGKQAYIFELK
jgi:glycosidase